MLLHVPSQRYKRLKIKNGQNDRYGNSSVKGLGGLDNPKISRCSFFASVSIIDFL